MLEEIMDVLTPRRTMSVGNLALQFDIEPEALHPRLEQLAAAGRVRYAAPTCSGSCSTCSTCSGSDEDSEDAKPAVDPTALVISLELRDTEE